MWESRPTNRRAQVLVVAARSGAGPGGRTMKGRDGTWGGRQHFFKQNWDMDRLAATSLSPSVALQVVCLRFQYFSPIGSTRFPVYGHICVSNANLHLSPSRRILRMPMAVFHSQVGSFELPRSFKIDHGSENIGHRSLGIAAFKSKHI